VPFHRPTNRITATSVAALPARSKSYDVSDLAVVGLLLRVAPTERKSWLLRFKWNGRPSRIKIGVFPQIGIAPARELALAHRRELEDGIDPRRARRPAVQRLNGLDTPRTQKPDRDTAPTIQTTATTVGDVTSAVDPGYPEAT